VRDLPPDLQSSRRLRFQRDRALQEAHSVPHLVTADGERRSLTQPDNCSFTQAVDLAVHIRPGQVDVLRPHGLRVMMGEQGGVLVPALAQALEPAREARVQAQTPRLREALVGDVSRQGVLEGERPLAGHRRTPELADEIAFDENPQAHVAFLHGFRGARRERPADDRGCLEDGLVSRVEHVDAGREECLHRVGDAEVRWDVLRNPSRPLAAKHASVHQRADQLFGEERVSLRPLDDDGPNRRWKHRLHQFVDEEIRLHRGEGVEPQQRPALGPRWMKLEKLRPRRDKKQEGARRRVEPADEGVEQVVLGPVHVLYEHNGRLRGDEVTEERAPRGVQAVASRERVQVRRRLEPERQAEDRVSAKAAAHRFGRIVHPQA
jgi:hypothetical protein